jgi:cell division septation protein DedD
METRRKSLLCPLCKRPAAADQSRESESRLCRECQSLVETIHSRNKTAQKALPALQTQYAPAVAAPALGADAVPADALSLEALEEEPEQGYYAEQGYYDADLSHAPEHAEVPPAQTQSEQEQQTEPERAEAAPATSASAQVTRPPIETKVAAPDWDYTTVSEWPLAVIPERGRARFRRGGLNIGIIILIAILLVCAIAGYFMIYRPFFSASRESSSDATAASPVASVASDDDSTGDKPAEKAPNQQAANQQGQSSSAEQAQAASADPVIRDTALSPPTTGRGMFSLQVASFPNEAAANEYSEKLIRAGIPGYVVAADLGRRGRWFRVRVGRFDTAAAAEQYAAQSRERARTIGLNIEPIVCDFEKP